MHEQQFLAAEPFGQLPSDLHRHIRPFGDGICDEVVQAIRTEIREYARPSDSACARTLRTGVEQAFALFLDRMKQPVGGSESVIATYRAIGRGEAQEGRNLDAFQMALRLGARVAWRRVNELAGAEILPRSVLAVLGEAMLVHLDEIAAATSVGYTEARLHAAGELQRRRRRLLDMLTSDPAPSHEALSDLAHASQWAIPGDLAVLLVDHAPESEAAPPILPPEFLSRFDQWPGCVVVPDPEGTGRARVVESALRGYRAALGPTVPVTRGAHSMRRAADSLALVRRGILSDRQVVKCAEHLSTMLLFRDEELVDALAERHLAAFAKVRPPHRHRLAETLLCWLQSGHNTNEVATRLGVHPQTVRYRLRQMEELIGWRLQDPDARFELELVLRVRQLRAAGADEPAERW